MAAIVFDLDGTLIDSAPDIRGVANAVLQERGLEPITMAETRDFIGNGAGVFVQKMSALRGIPEADRDQVLKMFMDRYEDAVTLTEPYPNVPETLGVLRDAGHRLGICTNKPIAPTKAVLAHLKLDQFFDTVWGGDSLSVRKPDPAPLFAAFAALESDTRFYVGDSDVDAETAQRAEISFFLFTEGYRKSRVEDLPHHTAFDDFSQLPELIG